MRQKLTIFISPDLGTPCHLLLPLCQYSVGLRACGTLPDFQRLISNKAKTILVQREAWERKESPFNTNFLVQLLVYALSPGV